MTHPDAGATKDKKDVAGSKILEGNDDDERDRRKDSTADDMEGLFVEVIRRKTNANADDHDGSVAVCEDVNARPGVQQQVKLTWARSCSLHPCRGIQASS